MDSGWAAGLQPVCERTDSEVADKALSGEQFSEPHSAELIAAMAGTRPAWITTQQTDEGLLNSGPSGRGTRRRGYEFQIHPSRIKQLPTGRAIVITPGTNKPTTALIHHPNEARS